MEHNLTQSYIYELVICYLQFVCNCLLHDLLHLAIMSSNRTQLHVPGVACLGVRELHVRLDHLRCHGQLAPAAAYRLALPVSAAAQPRAACSMAGRAARVCSIDMMQNLDGTGSFRTVQEYPCDLDVKIIGDNEGPFVNDMVTLCAERTGQKEADVGVAAWSDTSSWQRQSRPPTAPWLEAPSRLRTAVL